MESRLIGNGTVVASQGTDDLILIRNAERRCNEKNFIDYCVCIDFAKK